MNPTRTNNGDGTWTLTYPNGVVQIVDGATWEVVSESYTGGQMVESLPPYLPEGQSVVYGPDGTPSTSTASPGWAAPSFSSRKT